MYIVVWRLHFLFTSCQRPWMSLVAAIFILHSHTHTHLVPRWGNASVIATPPTPPVNLPSLPSLHLSQYHYRINFLNRKLEQNCTFLFCIHNCVSLSIWYTTPPSVWPDFVLCILHLRFGKMWDFTFSRVTYSVCLWSIISMWGERSYSEREKRRERETVSPKISRLPCSIERDEQRIMFIL